MGPRFEKIPHSLTNKNSDDDDGLQKLEQVLVRGLPKSVHLLVLCRIACQNAFPANFDIQFYRYTECEENSEENWKWWGQDGDKEPFIVCVQGPNIHAKKGTILLTPTNPIPSMIQAFDHLVDWSESQAFHCVQPPFWSHLQNLCTAHNNLKPENSLGVPAIMHTILDETQAKNLELTNLNGCSSNLQFTLRSLEDKDAAEVVEQYKWKVPHSEQVIRSCIQSKLVSCGLFMETGKEIKEEEMVSSVVQSPLGLFNILYTPEKHRRKGYGKIVIEWMTKEAAKQLGIPPIVEVESWNMASKKLLEKVGFEEVYHTKWFFYNPPPTSA